MNRLAVVCDFDGTATVLDIGDEISKHFGGEAHWLLQKRLFAEGKLDTRGIIQGIYTHVTATEREVREFAVREARLRDGFIELVQACKDAGAPFYLASGGLRQYVEAVLEAHLAPELRQSIVVRANEGHFDSGGLRVTFPGDEPARLAGCSECGSCKRVSVADARKNGASYVIGVGDGFADRCLARFADRLFAREGSYLHRWCEENRVACTPFTTLYGAADAVRTA
ncbi:MAG TPA: MtnX-like HAD-IB family phosphatase [Myxococcales bacterium]|jgi:2-hydroxy-3-keto-5-methylthiopentenyl-1-phosphate phosphatase